MLTDIIIQIYILSSIIYINIVLPTNTIEMLITYCRLSILTSIYRNNPRLKVKAKRYYSMNISRLNLTLGKLFSIVSILTFSSSHLSGLYSFGLTQELNLTVV